MRKPDANECLGLGVTTLLLIGIVLVAWGWALTGCSKSEALPSSTVAEPFVAEVVCVGTSMIPSFANGERVQVEFCGYGDLRSGETVIRRGLGDKGFNHHRLIGRNDTGLWVTRGDNNSADDPSPMGPGQFVGRTHKISP